MLDNYIYNILIVRSLIIRCKKCHLKLMALLTKGDHVRKISNYIWIFARLIVPLASPKIGYISEISKYIWYFARFVLPLQAFCEKQVHKRCTNQDST